MKELKLNEFLGQADDFLINASMGDSYVVETDAGRAVIISEEEYQTLIKKE